MCQLFIDADPALWTSHTRSFRMDGMVTSVRLEEMFWRTLETIGHRDDLTVPQLLHRLYNESLDAGHDVGNFTSFLRVCCLRFIDLQVRGLIPQEVHVKISQLPSRDILSIEAVERAKANPRLS
ncbi:MAG: ribbon-helix-helix domain-containing protein [Tateyamaria sp.]|jgi:predicted DNA-binding ribbon-helix-helix protein|nr:ribbon-helix-helix domain-containing protein [Tateyamaria sp.]MDG1183179.1 ribbon-helix-helix domain-containing protein [Tateyamaria sp.]MDG1336016.1 ribbon-helix-helix domain-containing protein [Tateyamaria sp.]MDG2055916.1 ribbon-helix-helix domain-containing protein [Tateyamaria sp.]